MLLVYYDDDYLFDRRSTPLNGYARNELTYQLRTIPAAVFLHAGGSFYFFVLSSSSKDYPPQKKNKTKCI